jgi:ABC-type Zn uptake system ZnuABC Zn-binding protein ZnuA
VEDPHWWHSIDNVMKATAVVEKRFVEADPANKEAYEKNAAAYLAKLKELKGWAKREVSKLPREKRKLVTSHDAFQYFARDFGFKIYSIEGVSTQDEPSSKKIADLINTIKRESVKAVFSRASRIRKWSQKSQKKPERRWAGNSTPTDWETRKRPPTPTWCATTSRPSLRA